MSNPTVPRYVSTAVRVILRTPVIHRVLSRNTMLLSFTGRRTGTAYTIPVSYCRDGDTVTCWTDSPWWKNLRDGAPVTVSLGREVLHGLAEPVAQSEREAVESLRAFLQSTPRDAKYHGVRRAPDGSFDPGDLARATRASVQIRIRTSARPGPRRAAAPAPR